MRKIKLSVSIFVALHACGAPAHAARPFFAEDQEETTPRPEYVVSAASFRGDAYGDRPANRLFTERAVLNANLDKVHYRMPDIDRESWAVGIEVPFSQRWAVTSESTGQRGDTPSKHVGVRYAVVPNRMQLDAALAGQRRTDPAARYLLGLRLNF